MMRGLAQRLPQIKQAFTRFFGGLDTETPPWLRSPGTVRESQNFDVDVNGGYGRGRGYERFSGKAAPSDASYSIITATITGSPAVGQTLLGNTSAATGTIIALPGGSFVLTQVVGTFVSGEALKIGGVTVATATSAAVPSSASTALLHAQYRNLAADVYRALIAAVPGSGDIRGIWMLDDVVYAFRDNVGATACAMYKSTTSGWSAVSFGEEVSFTAGNASVGDGDTLTQGGVTATIRRVVIQSGSAGAGTAAGRLIIAGRSGGNFAAGAASSTGGGSLTISGAQTAITLSPGGRFEFVNSNFSNVAGQDKMYGADGVNRGFEFWNDGSNDIFVPITTGMTTDTPSHVKVFQSHLFFSFGKSAQHSGQLTPYIWTIVSGAGELALDSDITNFLVLPGSETVGAMAIFSRNRINMLYGTSSADWVFTSYKSAAGAYAYTAQMIGDAMFLDDIGVTQLSTTANYGNFTDGTITKSIQRWINQERTKVTASSVSRNYTQYRLFFNDNYALFFTVINGKLSGVMPMLFAHKVACICSLEQNDGTEVSYFGSEDGYVFQLDKGTSHDGTSIEAYLMLSYDNQKSPRVLKSYMDGAIEINGTSYIALQIAGDIGYSSSEVVQQGSMAITANLADTRWDAFTWDSFVWDGQTLIPSRFELRGDGENVSIVIRCNLDYMERFVISGAAFFYIPRRYIR